MRAAVPIYGNRVSPRCHLARQVLLLSVDGGVVRERRTESFAIGSETDLVDRLVEMGVDVIVCGGIDRAIEEELRANGIRVLNNVVGEVEEIVAALRDGGLRPGHGFPRLRTRHPPPKSPKGTAAPDCVACVDRTCAAGGDCVLEPGTWSRSSFRGDEARFFEACQDVATEDDPKPCRIAEVVRYCIDAGLRRLGLAFCWELHHEVDVLVPVLRRFVEVRPVCCRVASRAANGESLTCNPLALSRVLERAAPDLVVLAGLCLGCDLIVTARSRAPVTTLFVKDRLLAHNPVGAIYTRYHLEDLDPGGPRARPRAVREDTR